MKPTDIIEIVDRVTPNAHTSEDKLRWLTELDEHLRAEKALLFPAPAPDEAQSGGDALEVSAPFAEELYTAYLQACMAWATRRTRATTASSPASTTRTAATWAI